MIKYTIPKSNRRFLHVSHLNGNHHACCEHQGSDSKAVHIGHIGQIRQGGDKDDGHEYPVSCWDVDLSLDCLRSVEPSKLSRIMG